MKKILFVLILIGVVYVIGNGVSQAISNGKQAAQALQGAQGSYPTFVIYKNYVSLAEKNGNLLLGALFHVNAPVNTSATLNLPNLLRDGSPVNIASSGVQMTMTQYGRRAWAGIRPVTNPVYGQTFSIARGNNLYYIQWAIPRTTLSNGLYQGSFSTYTASGSTTTIPLPQTRSNTIALGTNAAAALDGMDFMLMMHNNQSFSATATNTPLIAFRSGIARVKFCTLFEGVYLTRGNRLVMTLKEKTPCPQANNPYARTEQIFTTLARYGFGMTLDGQNLKMSQAMRHLGSHQFTFVKYTPTAVVAPRVYPCDFIGPLEVGAVRNCGGLIPTLAGVSPTTARIGAEVTVTGLNFGASNIVLMDNLSESTYGFLPVATVAAGTGATSIRFTIPNNHICPQPYALDGLIMQCPNVAITPGSYAIKVQTPGGQSLTSVNITVQAALPVPTITAVSPTTVRVGQPLTITGTNLVPPLYVKTSSGMIKLLRTTTSDTSLTFTVPTHIDICYPALVDIDNPSVILCTAPSIPIISNNQSTNHSISVQTLGGTSGTLPLTVGVIAVD